MKLTLILAKWIGFATKVIFDRAAAEPPVYLSSSRHPEIRNDVNFPSVRRTASLYSNLVRNPVHVRVTVTALQFSLDCHHVGHYNGEPRTAGTFYFTRERVVPPVGRDWTCLTGLLCCVVKKSDRWGRGKAECPLIIRKKHDNHPDMDE